MEGLALKVGRREVVMDRAESIEHRLVRLAQQVYASDDAESAAATVAGAACQFDGVDVAGMVRFARDQPSRIAATDGVLDLIDAQQFELDRGPLLTVPTPGTVHQVADTRECAAWPQWGEAVAAAGLGSVLIVGVPPTTLRPMALDLYRRTPGGFDERTAQNALLLARQAGLALRAVERIQNLQMTIRTRTLIGNAQGMLMERYGMDSSSAMGALRRRSQESNVKVSELAELLVQSGRFDTYDADEAAAVSTNAGSTNAGSLEFTGPSVRPPP